MSGPSVSVTVTYNNEKHNIQVVAQQENTEPTLQDMALLLEQVTGVPLAFQKLIFKGKSLKEMEQPLSALGVKNGCRVMLIGKKNSPEEEAELKKLRDLEKSVEKIADQLVGVNEELVGIQKVGLCSNSTILSLDTDGILHRREPKIVPDCCTDEMSGSIKGFLAKDLRAEALSKLDKRVKGTVEQFMKILEQIDSLTLPETFRDCRLKRKGLVKKVQAFLAQCDTVERSIGQETDKLRSKNLALAE